MVPRNIYNTITEYADMTRLLIESTDNIEQLRDIASDMLEAVGLALLGRISDVQDILEAWADIAEINSNLSASSRTFAFSKGGRKT